MSDSNTTYRAFPEKIGGSDATQFIGDKGELFWDPEDGQLRVSDGETPGGNVLIDTYQLSQSDQDIKTLLESYPSGWNIVPSNSNSDLGTEAKPWRELYLSGTSLHIGVSTITESGGVLSLNGSSIATQNNVPVVSAAFVTVPTSTSATETGFPSYTFTSGQVNSSNETITNGTFTFLTGDAVCYHTSSGSAVAGLTNNALYYIINDGSNVYRLADSYANAIAGNERNLTSSSGSGTHTLKLVNVTYDLSAGKVFVNNTNAASPWHGVFTNTGLDNNQAVTVKIISIMGGTAYTFGTSSGTFGGNTNRTNIYDITLVKNNSGTLAVYGQDYPE
jgi:hypothetical protein